MSEWWTYRLSDFLLFSPKTYYRLFELYHRDWWPLHLVAISCGVLAVALTIRRKQRAAAVLLGFLWLWVAWAFHFRHYATINWGARWFAGAFAVEALLLVSAKFQPKRPERALLIAVFFALLLFPLAGVFAGRSWQQAELFGMTPDPTALATIGFVLLLGGRKYLLIVPLIWCAISGATLWTLRAPDALVLPVAATVTLIAGARRSGKD